ncbi:hypothetical protein [Mycobacterium interjectum]|uniref:hypothetical protein n=1 Tax=Mycobacterium interjectum TaxID=33895 RepID=UPI001155A5ED|nr:hypothetical protein [Mycobacterium interjectum]MCV7090744.1 hypothetical protein [Mycobacterium interjectum]
MIAALVVAVVVLAGIAGVTGYLLLQQKRTSPGPDAKAAPPPGQAAQLAPPPAAVPTTTPHPISSMPGVVPFVGRWGGGNAGGSIEIDADGSGSWRFSDRSTCPNAPMVGCGIIGIAEFELKSVVNGTGTGSVTATSSPSLVPLGEPVTIVLGTGPQGQGAVLSVSIAKMQGWNFCNGTTPHYCAGG